uniref:Protein kinase domain-containing protein n=2 Tax=Octactis speculum TaxID=3111310 RepID=A0A7S2F7V9_9STRA|mmetsp:Transcript_15967/g.21516  ORF Transcript_15967/g.21516 Transcript_15967/m.21516 type:complete len:276 (+) Transcript_15967:544-1371(+)
MRSIEHENLVHFSGAFRIEPPLPEAANLPFTNVTGFGIVMEYCQVGDLDSVRLKVASGEVELCWALRLRIAREIATALRYLHEREIIHRDVKSQNILLDNNWTTKLCDLGVAVAMDADFRLEYTGGTECMMAPEQLLGMEYSVPVDIFSMGLVFLELTTLKKVGDASFMERLPNNNFECDVDEIRGASPADAPPSFVELIVQCCDGDPDNRPSADDAVAWIEDLEASENLPLTIPPAGGHRSVFEATSNLSSKLVRKTRARMKKQRETMLQSGVQ